MYMTNFKKIIHKFFHLRAWLILTILFCTACEAPLNLKGIEEQSGQAILRFDNFQAAATNNDSLVVVGSAGVVVVSVDNGDTWSRQTLSGYPPLIDITACSDGSYVILDFSKHIWLSNDNAKS